MGEKVAPPQSELAQARENFKLVFRNSVMQLLAKKDESIPSNFDGVVLTVESSSSFHRPIKLSEEPDRFFKGIYLHDVSPKTVRISLASADVIMERGSIYAGSERGEFIPVFPADRSIREEVHSISNYDFNARTYSYRIRRRMPIASNVPIQDRSKPRARQIHRELTPQAYEAFEKLVMDIVQSPHAIIHVPPR